MSEYRFGRPVTIDGKEYRLTSNREEAKKILEHQIDRIEQIRQEGGLQSKMYRKIYAASERAVDALIGKGGFRQIFSEQKPNVYEISGILKYLDEEYRNWDEEMTRDVPNNINKTGD